MVWKKFPDLKFFSLILAEKPLFFPDFPDWKKSSKFSLNSLIGENPAIGRVYGLSIRRSYPFKVSKSVIRSLNVHFKSLLFGWSPIFYRQQNNM